jgi:hypothetical protein
MPRNVTVATLKTWARNEIATDDDALISAAIDAAEQWVDNTCQRRFVVATTATPRTYTPVDLPRLLAPGIRNLGTEGYCAQVLRIHDCTSVTTVSNNGTIVAASGYQLEPLNALGWSGETYPYNAIRLLTGTSWDTGTYLGQATATITATWGWTAIPAPVIESVKILAKDIIANRDLRFGIAAVSGEGFGISARANGTVTALLAPYRRAESWGIA